MPLKLQFMFVNFGKMRQTTSTQLAFRRTINVYLGLHVGPTYLFTWDLLNHNNFTLWKSVNVDSQRFIQRHVWNFLPE